jgi:hypothetical protein
MTVAARGNKNGGTEKFQPENKFAFVVFMSFKHGKHCEFRSPAQYCPGFANLSFCYE